MQPTEYPPTRRLRQKTHVVARLGAEEVWKQSFLADQELAQEDVGKRKTVYLVTLPHPRHAMETSEGVRAPDELSHADVEKMFLDIFADPVHVDLAASQRNATSLRLEKMVIYKEKHAPDADGVAHVHYHVALQGSHSFRFMAYKRALRTRHGVISHWSCSHEGYWSAVRYGYFPIHGKKAQEDLDKDARCWARSGAHPPLFQASQPGNTAAALQQRREHIVKAASADGAPEPRAGELDLYAVIVREGFRNTPDDPWACKKLVEFLRTSATPGLFQYAFKIRSKLSALIDDVWAWETVSDDLALLGQSRLERLVAAGKGPCTCAGWWRHCAEWALQANCINATELCGDVWRSIAQGRCESLPVVVLMGKHGGEGKSFVLAPLRSIYGQEYVQASPEIGSFPLLDLELKRLVLLDEWDFADHVVPLSTQLLWYEGKAFPIKRPQNNNIGHLLYKGTAPIFITCKEKVLGPMIVWAQQAAARGEASHLTMLLRRLKVYGFSVKLPLPEGTQISECGACFSQMIQHYASQAGVF